MASGINWLKSVQGDDGLYGEEVGNPTLYNHAIATMAMGEAYRISGRSPVLQPSMRKATNLILAAQNPYAAWRYKLEPNGDNDTSITGWMVFALKTAEGGGLAVDHSAYSGAANWFTTMENKNTGRVGYGLGDDGGGPGSYPSRPVHLYERYPAEKSEALTAVALLCRIFMTDTTEVKRWQDHPDYESLRKQADLVLSKRPKWDEEDGSIDMYFWYYGTFADEPVGRSALARLGEGARRGAAAETSIKAASVDNFHGSWDPVGAWGRGRRPRLLDRDLRADARSLLPICARSRSALSPSAAAGPAVPSPHFRWRCCSPCAWRGRCWECGVRGRRRGGRTGRCR